MEVPPDRREDDDALVPQPVERNVGRTLARYGIGFSLLALLIAAGLFRSWTVFVIGVIFVVAFVMLITAPVWLGLSGEVADRTKAKERGLGREDLRKP
jgi:multisubunit Na+/H+ antiporter MnhG subunit